MASTDVLTVAIAILTTAGFSFLSVGLGVLDRPGAVVSFFLGMTIVLSPALFPVDGFLWLALLVLFVLSNFGITRLFFDYKVRKGVAEGKKGVRGWRNVAAVGLVPTILAVLATWLDPDLVAIGFAVAVATASSDTFASELGVLSDKTYLIVNPRKRVSPGTNGGVSSWGHLMAALGALVPSVLAIPLLGLPWHLAWIPAVAGWLGCQLDSVLGALFEEERGRIYGFMTKSDVNFLSIATASFTVLLLLVS